MRAVKEIDPGQAPDNRLDGTVMNSTLAIAAGTITLALVFYTIGVFAERRAGTLRPRHLAFFYLGLACDATGTSFMSLLAQGGVSTAHAVTGALALVLMLAHVMWATVVVVKGSPAARTRFHRLSMGVWLVWLVPYVCGMLIGIPAFKLDANVALLVAIVVSCAAFLILRPRKMLRR